MDGAAPTHAVRTTCPYCGVGCGVRAKPEAIAGDLDHPANRGRLCAKGMALGETLGLEDRLLHPEIRGARASWDDALAAVADGFASAVRAHGPDAVAFYVSGQLLTEDYYVANKLIKGFIGTANIDTNSRLCMASSVAGHRRAFGADTVPGTYKDLEEADLVVLVGSNLAWCHPVLFQRLIAARRKRGTKIVVIDPRRTATCADADLHLPLPAGSDVALFNGLLVHLAGAGCIDRDYVARHTTGFDAALAVAEKSDLAACRLPATDVAQFFAWFAATPRTVTVFSQGVNQSSAGVDKVNAIINCHLATGRIGKPGAGPFSVTGQPNAMGGREVGALANQLAAHLDFAKARDIDRLHRFWRAPNLATRPGLKAVELFEAVAAGRIKALWIMATNPAVSLPDADAVRAALTTCPLVVVSDCMRATDTMDLAHIRLPALAWGEKDGTVTNSERRISRQRAFLPAPGEAKADWWIVSAVARRMGHGDAFGYAGPADIFREHAALSAFENGGTRDFDIGALATLADAEYDALTPTMWPCPASGKRRTRFFADGGFFTADGRGCFVPTPPRPPVNAVDAKFPLVLNTGRVRDHWHTLTRTAKSPRLSQHTPEPTLDIHPADAAALTDGALATVASRWGRATARVRITTEQMQGSVALPMHWSRQFAAQGAVNAAVNPAVDPISGQPELKHTPVRVAPFAASWHGFALTRAPLDCAGVPYWVRATADGFLRYELAGDQPAAESWRDLRARLGEGAWIDYRDDAAGCFRSALLRDGRLAACLFIAPTIDLPARERFAALFAATRLGATEQAVLLAGRSPSGAVDGGKIVCACFGVGHEALRDVIAQGLATTEAIGTALKAGTNCGSCLPEIRALLAQAPAAAE
jgi:assimilatory nitrate reductase catalytic subunit